jgi:hypothetical protein
MVFGWKKGAGALGQSLGGTLVGISIGAATFAYLSESFVTVTMALVLLGGSLFGWVSCQRLGWKTIAGIGTLSRIATAWTATPGSVIALGLIMAGYDGPRFAYSSNQFHLWPTVSRLVCWAELPLPQKTDSVPPHEGLGPDDRENLQD